MRAAQVLKAREMTAATLIGPCAVLRLEWRAVLVEAGTFGLRLRCMQIDEQVGRYLRMAAFASGANNVAPIGDGNRTSLLPGGNRRIGHAEIAPQFGVARPC